MIYDKPSFADDALLAGVNLECVRGYNTLFTALNFTICSASALQLIGENGSGKTSLLRILAGLSEPEQGTISWNNRPIADTTFEYFASLDYLGHKIALKDNLTPRENLCFLGSLADCNPTLSVEQSLHIMQVMALADSPCFQLSAGQRQRVALARILRSHARLWLLDEPATALDREGMVLLQQVMMSHLNAGGIIVYSSHQPLAISDQSHQSLHLNPPTAFTI